MQRLARLISGLLVLAGVLTAPFAEMSFAQQKGAPSKAEQSNMELVGHDDLQARSAYQPVVHKQGAHWIAYVGHHGGMSLNPLTGKQEPNGTSIVDVTDPKQPKYLAHIPGQAGSGEAGGAQMVRVCDGSELPRADKSKVYLLRPFGMSAEEILGRQQSRSAQPRTVERAAQTRAGVATAASPTSLPARPAGAPSA